MRLVCISKGNDYNLTIGKIYDNYISEMKMVINHVYIIDDSGLDSYYPMVNFKLLDEVREERINIILNE
jgi:hypothetical protein